ncbi:hypothetical protein Taro_003383 [Colocasia esculenta]|uniref:Protein kinase domain-containing protein n=1 Tax=Colocasia esculenta TaxID=4460 RepID=A0A843TNL3_COLES|nr:hypothetical protein [Colocasia esculenta]
MLVANRLVGGLQQATPPIGWGDVTTPPLGVPFDSDSCSARDYARIFLRPPICIVPALSSFFLRSGAEPGLERGCPSSRCMQLCPFLHIYSTQGVGAIPFPSRTMAHKIAPSQQTEPFEYVLYEGDPDHLKTVVSSPIQKCPRISPDVLKLTHRIGRGVFGDLWIATHHLFTEDYDEYHEVAVKMLHPMKEDQIAVFLAKFDEAFSKCQGLRGVCLLQGILKKMGNVCIAMKFYEGGSVGDKMARLKGGRLPMSDTLRYGIDLVQGIMELHSRGLLVLNVKPCNVLLEENDRAILGDFGLPYLLLEISLPSSDLVQRLGTPNYMAPEQWQPDIRGPISYETDTWGFGCCILEMLSGTQPWCGRSPEEIYHLVVTKQEKPNIPRGLPPALEDVLHGCFEYDLRNRPLFGDILHAFESCKDRISDDGSWVGPGTNLAAKLTTQCSFTDWSLMKDHLQVGDIVRSRKPKNICRLENMEIPEGTVVGMESSGERGAHVLVRVHGIHDPLRVPLYTLERVSFGFACGDWVRIKREVKKHSPVGILHSVNRDGSVSVGFVGMETLWQGNCTDLQMAESYCVGQFVRLKANLSKGRFEWPHKKDGTWATGRISQIFPNACLVVRFPGILRFGDAGNFLADPAEVEMVSFSTCDSIVKKYQHLEDFHWVVRPLVIAMGLFTVLKLGFFVGKIGKSRRKKLPGSGLAMTDRQQAQDSQSASSSTWLPPPVANILFREGSTSGPASR